MAIVKSGAANLVETKLQRNMPLQREAVVLRLKSSEFGISNSSKNPMVTEIWEIASPASVEQNGKKLVIGGFEYNRYFPTKCLNGKGDKTAEELTAGAQQRYAEHVQICGGSVLAPIPGGKDWDDENPPLQSEGTMVNAVVSSREKPMINVHGKPLTDGDGKPIMQQEHVIEMITGPSQSHRANTAY